MHAWEVKRKATILECAARIHTDLARGFIRGDVVSFCDFMQCHSMSDARARGLAKLVDRDYIAVSSEKHPPSIQDTHFKQFVIVSSLRFY